MVTAVLSRSGSGSLGRSPQDDAWQACSKEEFIVLRKARDATLPMPRLILQALQANIAGGRLPAPEDNGVRYLKIPLDALAGVAWEWVGEADRRGAPIRPSPNIEITRRDCAA